MRIYDMKGTYEGISMDIFSIRWNTIIFNSIATSSSNSILIRTVFH